MRIKRMFSAMILSLILLLPFAQAEERLTYSGSHYPYFQISGTKLYFAKNYHYGDSFFNKLILYSCDLKTLEINEELRISDTNSRAIRVDDGYLYSWREDFFTSHLVREKHGWYYLSDEELSKGFLFNRYRRHKIAGDETRLFKTVNGIYYFTRDPQDDEMVEIGRYEDGAFERIMQVHAKYVSYGDSFIRFQDEQDKEDGILRILDLNTEKVIALPVTYDLIDIMIVNGYMFYSDGDHVLRYDIATGETCEVYKCTWRDPDLCIDGDNIYIIDYDDATNTKEITEMDIHTLEPTHLASVDRDTLPYSKPIICDRVVYGGSIYSDGLVIYDLNTGTSRHIEIE